MTDHARVLLWKLPFGVLISVVASLAVVWLLSESTGMRFNPGFVAVLAASVSAAMIWRGQRD